MLGHKTRWDIFINEILSRLNAFTETKKKKKNLCVKAIFPSLADAVKKSPHYICIQMGAVTCLPHCVFNMVSQGQKHRSITQPKGPVPGHNQMHEKLNMQRLLGMWWILMTGWLRADFHSWHCYPWQPC